MHLYCYLDIIMVIFTYMKYICHLKIMLQNMLHQGALRKKEMPRMFIQHAGHFLYLTNVSSLKKLPSPADLRYDLLLRKPSA